MAEHNTESVACGSFGCTLPRGHNMGRLDIPENHSSGARTAEYALSVHERLTVRGRLALGRTANELREAGYTSALAEQDGWTVDRHSYPWVAYLGARFDTDAFVFLLADEDTQSDGTGASNGR